MPHGWRIALAVSALCLSSVEPIEARAKEEQLPVRSLNLGDSVDDLLYTPTAPCRVVDTRLAGGLMAPSTTRSFRVVGSASLADQGGNPGGCGVPAGATAAQLNVVAVDPAGLGNLKGSAFPEPIPVNGAVVNYQALTPNLNVANAIILPLCNPLVATCTNDITLFTNGAGTHVVIDVLGYFKRFPREQLITLLAPGTGMAGGGSSGTVVLGIAESGVDTGQIAPGAVTGDKINTEGAIAGQALRVTGGAASWQSVPQGSITGVTAGTGLSGGGTSGNVSVSLVFSGIGSGTASRSDHRHYFRTITVSPVGTDLQNGTALMNAIAGITDADATKPYLLKIEPGTYQIDNASTFQMKPHVDVEGSGERLTRLIHANANNTYALVAANPSEVRFLSIECAGASVLCARAVSNSRFTHVSIQATSTDLAFGLDMPSNSVVTLRDVAVVVNSDGSNLGIGAGPTGSNLTLSRVSVNTTSNNLVAEGLSVTNGTLFADELRINATSDPVAQVRGLTLTNSTATVINSAVVVTGSPAQGILNQWSDLTMMSTTSLATATSAVAYGCLGITITATNRTQTLQGSSCIGKTSSTAETYGLYVTGNAGLMTTRADGCLFSGTTFAARGDSTAVEPIFIGNSRLEGGPTVVNVCAFVFDENYFPFTSSCPL